MGNPDTTVEAVAKALHSRDVQGAGNMALPWEELPNGVREDYLEAVRGVLKALADRVPEFNVESIEGSDHMTDPRFDQDGW